MGWKIAVAIARLDGRSLQTFVDEVYGGLQTLRASDIPARKALYRRHPPRQLALDFDGFGWIFDWKLVERSFTRPIDVQYAISTFILLSTVNYYGFSSQTNGAHDRVRVGDGDNGIRVDTGTPSEAERRLASDFAKPGHDAEAWSTWCDDSRSFNGQYEDMTHDAMGEDIVLGLVEALVGFHPADDTPIANAFCEARTMEIVQPPSLFARLFGKR
jgi:hypothetical protein